MSTKPVDRPRISIRSPFAPVANALEPETDPDAPANDAAADTSSLSGAGPHASVATGVRQDPDVNAHWSSAGTPTDNQ